MKGSFQIRASEEKVITEKGLRAFVMDELLNSPLSKGTVINIDDKTVDVWLEGDEKQIKKFKEELEKKVIAKFGNPVIAFADFLENTLLEVPNLMRSSQALLVGQLHKGIGVQLEILGGQKEILGALQNMGDSQKEILTALKSLPEEFAEKLKN